ncbi:ATP-binding protein [Enterococcus faecium]|nr:ATP-binding protein [Enterococcus faecium]EGP5366375.1 ATP-binding protein [Enterococcus faecium]NTQ54674.1 ATP-binding protein [Enterococcus faecium]
MLKKIELKIQQTEYENFYFTPQTVNLIVGPNNSGKSLFLRELNENLQRYNNGKDSKILKNLEILPIKQSIVNEILSKNEKLEQNGKRISFFDNSGRAVDTIDRGRFDYYAIGNTHKEDMFPESAWLSFKRHVLGENTIFINGATRLQSMNFEAFSTIDSNSYGVVSKIINNEKLFDQLQKLIFEVFNLYIEIFINGSQAKFVLSREKMPEELRLSIKPQAIDFLSNAYDENETSDGRKAYLGILSQFIVGRPEIFLLDEPEAFLHPPLARKLGQVISSIAHNDNKQVYISTHNSNLIMGCVEAHVPINVIRLTYNNEIPKAKLLNSKKLEFMMRNPLLRSTNVLDAIFYKNVIVTESDSDRAFYQEINNRLREFKPEWAIDDCLFLNAQNKQTVGVIVRTLREIGIPAASILDFDMIKDGGNVFTSYLSSVGIPKSLFSSFTSLKTEIQNEFPRKENGQYAKNSELKTQGLNFLKTNAVDKYESAQEFIERLRKYGLFVVENGELESWLPNIPIENHGTQWLIKKFEAMGDDAKDSNYVKPTDGDVWQFLYNIKCWFENENKKGMNIE